MNKSRKKSILFVLLLLISLPLHALDGGKTGALNSIWQHLGRVSTNTFGTVWKHKQGIINASITTAWVAFIAFYFAKSLNEIIEANNEKLEHEAWMRDTDLFIASRKGDIQKVKFLVNSSADINYQEDYLDDTSLHIAVRENRTEIIKFLLEHGADINTKGIGGTPLHTATKKGYFEIVKILLEYGAEVNAQNAAGQTPLDIAIHKDYLEITKILLEYGADINSKDEKGRTLLHIATFRNSGIVKALLRYGLDINARDNEGWTPLHYAADGANTEMVLTLVNSGANIRIKNNKNKTAYDVARWAKEIKADLEMIPEGSKEELKSIKKLLKTIKP